MTLVQRAAAGDSDGWDELVRRYWRLVWAVARSYGLERADAWDVTQTTWLRLAERLGTIREPGRVGAWLVTTAKHEALRVARASQRTLPTDLPPVIDVTGGRDADDPLLERERSTAVWQAFDSLPPSCKSLLRLLITEPVPSYVEISEVLGMPVGSIGPTRARCLSRLRDRATQLVEGLPDDEHLPRRAAG